MRVFVRNVVQEQPQPRHGGHGTEQFLTVDAQQDPRESPGRIQVNNHVRSILTAYQSPTEWRAVRVYVGAIVSSRFDLQFG